MNIKNKGTTPVVFMLSLIISVVTPIFVSSAVAASSQLYTFNVDGILQEASSISQSSSQYFWVNSGAKLIIKDGIGMTIQGALPSNDKWRLLYAKSNPLDTGDGYYPQNIFRLITRNTWKNIGQEVAFKITKTNLTNTPNRAGYSGVLLMSRYQDDGQTMYYGGIRQDGTAIIKKKIRTGTSGSGTYYTIASGVNGAQNNAIFSNGKLYDKYSNPNLIPENKWMKLKLEVKDMIDSSGRPNGKVSLALYIDKLNNGTWTLIANGEDSSGKYGGSPIISNAGYAGVRTDYMDVQFDNYRLIEF